MDMRLKEDAMASITPEELHDLFTALDFTRKDVAQVCGLSEFAPGRWRQSGRIPLIHLGRLWEALQAKLKSRKDLTPVEQRAQQFMWRQFDLHRTTGSAIPVNSKSAINGDKDAPDTEPRRVQPFSNHAKHDQLLSAISLEELLHEIGRRGFKVQVEPRE